MVRFEARSDGDVVEAQLRVDLTALGRLAQRLTQLLHDLMTLTLALYEAGHRLGWW
jgi:hypothetical protein